MKVLVSAHDAGGALAVLPVVRALKERDDEVLVVLGGPARDIFSRANIAYLDEVIGDDEVFERIHTFGPERVLAGTSAELTIEKRILSRLQGSVPTLSVLDFWSNYVERFSVIGKDSLVLPDAICVMDERARTELLHEGFPGERLVVTGNPHFEHFADAVTTTNEDVHTILFIAQPLTEASATDYGFTEFSVLESLVRVVEALPSKYVLSIRLHPREQAGKYDTYTTERVSISSELSLEEALSNAGLVIGMNSPVLIQAAIAGKQVLSYQLNRTTRDVLPTNVEGVTVRVETEEELQRLMRSYIAGKRPCIVPNAGSWNQDGATARVLAVLDALATPGTLPALY